MLVRKKISAKKLAIYIFIIVLMLGGIGFVLYRNSLLPGLKPSALDNPAPNGNALAAGVAVPGDQAALDQSSADPLKTGASSGQPLGASKINNQGIDLTIFSNEKFKALEENILIYQADPALGKINIFAPN